MDVVAFLWGTPVELAYPIVFAAALAKSATLPVPGTTTLVAAVSLAASSGDLLVPLLAACAVLGATVGGHVGYLGGARGGRWLLTRTGRWQGHREKALSVAEAFWARHGALTVLVARLFPVLRHVGGFLAGTNAMPVRRFALVNAGGAVLWAAWGTLVALVALVVGAAAGGAAGVLGSAVIAVAVSAVVGAVGARRLLGGLRRP
jgi:membrane protein DedA with SNARE-associated domain